jgi:hypothetical protein
MVTSIARQSVIIKCNQQASVLLGNYEFYYLAGLTKKLFNFPVTEDMEPEMLFTVIKENISNAAPKDEKEDYLLKLVEFYKPLPVYDEQTKELFRWGANEDKLWQVQI